MSRKRVVVTGLGVVSCFGQNVDEYYERLLAGESGIRNVTKFDVETFSTKFGGSIDDFDAGEYLDKKQARRVDPFIAYGVVGGKRAIEHAGFDLNDLGELDLSRCGVILGSGMGGMQFWSTQAQAFAEKGARRLSPFFIPYTITNMASGMLGMELGFMGPNFSISTACATANHSIMAAADAIRLGRADLMVCGGVEASMNPIGLAGFCSIKALSTRNDAPELASRPWDKGRDGFVMGEGCGALVIESLEHAQARGATILAEFMGGGATCDAYHLTDSRPDGEGIAACIRMALREAELEASEINYVNAHATSTPVGDMAEVHGICKVLKDPSKVTINGTKSLIGHCLGAAGGMEAIVCVKAIETGQIHPTANLEDPEEGIKAFHAPSKACERKITAALSNSFGFGGHNATLIFAPFSEGS